MTRQILLYTLIAGLSLAIAQRANGQELTFKNDFLAPGGRDRWLTNEFVLRYDRFAVGQEMYTPTNKRSAEIPEGDRPWDGYAYAEYSHELTEGRDLNFRLGALGDASRAKRLQKWIHNDLGFGSDPQGWDTANPSELALDLEYVRRNLEQVDSLIGVSEFASGYGVRAGNVRVSAWLEQELRKGFNVGATSIRAIGGIRGELVAFNTFLDGRMFHDDVYTVERQPFVASAFSGIEVSRDEWFVRYTYQYLTEEFEGQDGRHLFAVLELGRR